MYEEQEKLYRQCKDLYNRNDYINGLNIINKIVDDYNHNNNELFYEDKIDSLIKYLTIYRFAKSIHFYYKKVYNNNCEILKGRRL